MIQTGLRVSELIALRVRDVQPRHRRSHQDHRQGPQETLQRPLTSETVAVLRAWLKERKGQPDDPLFPTRQGQPLSRYAVGAAPLKARRHRQPPTAPHSTAKRVTPHTLRHTNAMLLRAKDVDIATIALWLGHESTETTQIYLHADPALKEKAIARTAPLGAKPGRYQPSDTLLAFLETL